MADKNESTPGKDMVGDLIAAAGPGPTADPAAKERIYKAVRAHWEKQTRGAGSAPGPDVRGTRARAGRPVRRLRRWRAQAIGGAAAVAAVAISLSWLQNQGGGGGVTGLADIQYLAGQVEFVRNDRIRDLATVAANEALIPGDLLRTGADGRMALSFDDGLALRMNGASAVRLIDDDAIELVSGTVYIDSGRGITSGALAVVTRLGSVRHVGTQYEVQVTDASLRIRVREGRVAVSGQVLDATGTAGEQLDIAADGRLERSAIAADDPAWDWTVRLARLAEMDAYELGATLEWIARERGLTLEYANAAVRRDLRDRELYDIGGLDPIEALDVVTAATDFDAEIADGRLLVAN